MKSRRIGTFEVDLDMIDERPKDVRGIMEQCVILHAETMWHKHCIEYTALCEQFPEILPGEMPTRIDWFKTVAGPWLAEYKPRKKAA